MKQKRNSHLLTGSGLVVACMSAITAHAGATINFGDDQSASIGLGLRTSYDSNSGNDQPTSQSFNVDNLRLYTNFSFSKELKATFNTEYNSSLNSVSLLDAYAQFEPSQSFNVWLGRLLPGADRADMEGPFYITSWSYPGVASVYKEQYLDGRDQGATVWGVVADDRLTYAVGAYQGRGHNSGISNQYQGGGGSSDLMYTGRLNYNFWDTKVDPAYFASSSYYGTKDVLALGLAGMTQKNGVTSASGVTADYKAWNIDFLMEKKVMEGGAFTLSGAYYKVDTQGVLDSYCQAGSPGCWGGPAYQGTAYLGTVAFLFPQKLGYGKFQPYYQHQDFRPDSVDTGTLAGQTVETKKDDFGLNYIVKGYDAKFTAAYERVSIVNAPSANSFILGAQLQF
jgi:hypothetical protein